MIVELNRKGLETLVKGSSPYYSEFDNPLVKKAGHSYSDQYGRTSWDSLNKLTENELLEGYGNVMIAEKGIKRPLSYIAQNPYVKNLLSRNWFQVKNSEAIYAIGTFFNKSQTIVKGGTGWAVQMAIDNKKPVYLFEQNLDHWFVYYYPENKFTEIYVIPELTPNFAGIGTREITYKGKQAIKEIYKVNFEQYDSKRVN